MNTTEAPTRIVESTHRVVNTETGEVSNVRETPKESLFNADSYIDVPVMDGQATDKLTISFSGSIEYSAHDWQGRALFEKMTLGKELELRVTGVVVGKSGSWKLNSSEEEIVTGNAKMRISDIYVMSPEDLV